MDTISIYTPTLSTPRTNSSPPQPAHQQRQVIRETTDQTTPHTRRRRAKGPLPTRSTVTTGNCPAQKRHSTHNPPQHEQITMEGIAYETVDITADGDARDYVLALGYLQAPVVVAGDDHWSGFRPDRIKTLPNKAA
jgi:glutaredoxin-like protein NrdH